MYYAIFCVEPGIYSITVHQKGQETFSLSEHLYRNGERGHVLNYLMYIN